MSKSSTSQHNKKSARDTLDLTEQIQALFPSELKTLPIDEGRLDKSNPIGYHNVQIDTIIKRETQRSL